MSGLGDLLAEVVIPALFEIDVAQKVPERQSHGRTQLVGPNSVVFAQILEFDPSASFQMLLGSTILEFEGTLGDTQPLRQRLLFPSFQFGKDGLQFHHIHAQIPATRSVPEMDHCGAQCKPLKDHLGIRYGNDPQHFRVQDEHTGFALGGDGQCMGPFDLKDGQWGTGMLTLGMGRLGGANKDEEEESDRISDGVSPIEQMVGDRLTR